VSDGARAFVARAVLISLVALVAVWLINGVAEAGHCTGDKDHLQDGSCGYYTEESATTPEPSPSPTPTLPVTIENEPRVKVTQPSEDDPLRVQVSNWPEAPELPSDGWSSADSVTLIALAEEHKQTQRIMIFGLALLIFLLAGSLVLTLRTS